MAKKAYVRNSENTEWVELASATTDLTDYLTQVNASTTYLTQVSASTTYVNKTVGGLNLVVPTSVTGGTISENGEITIGSGVTSIAVNGVFSSVYDNYKILFYLDSHNGGASPEFQLQGISSSYFTTGYYQSFGVSTLTGYSSSSIGFWYTTFNNAASTPSSFQMDLMSPNLAKRKYGSVSGQAGNGCSQVNISCNSTTQSTGFNISKTGDTMTGGTIRIYGYNNGS